MARFDAVEDYLRQVTGQIRWKRARPVIRRELKNHLEDQCNAFLAAGMSLEEARAETVRQMGDPVSVGKELDLLHRPRPEWSLMGLALLLLGAGILFSLLSTGFQWDEVVENDLPALLIGLAFGTALYFWDSRLLLQKPVRCAALLAVLPLFTRRFYSTSFDLTHDRGLFLLPLAMALMLYAMREHGWRGTSVCLQFEFLLVIVCMQAGSAAFACFVALYSVVLLLCRAVKRERGRRRGKAFALVLVPHIVAGALVLLIKKDSIDAFLSFKDTLISQALGGCGWFSPGTQPLRGDEIALLRERFPLTWLAHQYGMIFAAVFVMVFVLFLAQGFRVCLRQHSDFAKYCAGALLLPIAFETLGCCFNCAGLAGGAFFLPFVGVSGPALVLQMAMVGLLLGLFRQNEVLEGQRLRHWFLGECLI